MASRTGRCIFLNGLGDAGVSSQMMVVVGAQDVQSNILIVRDIEQSAL